MFHMSRKAGNHQHYSTLNPTLNPTSYSGVARIFCGEVLFTNKRNFFVGLS